MTRPEDEQNGGSGAAGAGDDFDAVGAAEELEESLAEAGRAGSGESDVYVDMLEGEVAAMQRELAAARERVARTEQRAADAAAEVERSKARLAREAEREQTRHRHGLLGRFLEVLDDLDRAIGAAREMDHNPDVLAGIELVRKRFLAALAEYGVHHVPALGERFDPAMHEAVSAVPVEEADQDGQIVGVVSEGYEVEGDVLRPARVAVGKAAS
jgi:molecular chaperone GrpE